MRIGSDRSVRVQRNVRNQMSGVAFLRSLRDEEAKIAFCDPQYRGILDQMAYGNEGARQKGRAALPQMDDDTIAFFVEEIERVLKPSGYLFLWLDKFSIASAHHLRFFVRTKFQTVDLITWNKMRIGLGKRARCQTEFLLVAQKKPIQASRTWLDHSIGDSWAEQSDPTIHPHAKPTVLTERLIRSTTKRGDLVIDPCAGGYGVLEVCRRTGRDFAGCDLKSEGEPVMKKEHQHDNNKRERKRLG